MTWLPRALTVSCPIFRPRANSGHPELEIDGMSGIFGGKAISDALRNRIAKDIAAICHDPEVRGKLQAGGHNVLSDTTEVLKAGIARQRVWVGEITGIIDIRNAQ
jgi:tripartite-type tricarboxylate transporter receptor subunit TctC